MYAVILDACPRGKTTVTIRQEYIAKECCISRQTVNTTIHKLEEIGLITKTKNSRASTYEIKPVVNPKKRFEPSQMENYTPQTESPSEGRTDPKNRKCRKKPVQDVIREQEIDKYLDLVN